MDGEGDANSAQLFHGLLLQVSDVAAVVAEADHGLAVVSLTVEAHLLGDQSGVLLTLGVVADTGHGVVVVLALQGVDLVGAGVVVGEVDALVEALTECAVGNSLVPVLIQIAVLILALEVQVHLVAELGGALLAQELVVLVVGIGGDGGQVGLGQVDVIELAVLVELQAHGQVGDHGDGVMLETGAVVCSVVVGVGDEALGVLLDVLLDEVRTIVPHGGVIAGAEAIDAQLVDEVLRGGVEAVVSSDSVEVGAGVLAGEDQSVVVRCLDADTSSQHILVGHVSSSVALVLGQVVVLSSAHDGLRGHGGVEGLVLERVQDPLKTHEEVLGGQVRLDLAVDVAPIDIVAQVEGPDGGVLVGLPARGDGGHQLAVAVEAHQAVPQVGDDVGVAEGLAVQQVPALDLTVGRLPGDILLEGSGTGRVGGFRAGSGRAAGVVGLAAAAGGQQAGGTHDACALQEAAAGDVAGLKIDVH